MPTRMTIKSHPLATLSAEEILEGKLPLLYSTPAYYVRIGLYGYCGLGELPEELYPIYQIVSHVTGVVEVEHAVLYEAIALANDFTEYLEDSGFNINRAQH